MIDTPRRWVDDYEITGLIGHGGMAMVYLARQASLAREVALKELSSLQLGSPDTAQRFVRESRVAGSLNHPNIVTVFEFFEHGGFPYIAMEYLPRGSLRPYVGRLSLAQFIGVMEGVLAGLTEAEKKGIVHRDLKPENLLVTDDGRVKIADFGIAKAREVADADSFRTATGMTVGTPSYMAPEQAMALDVGVWTDLYSVGVMAWEHVVGRVPFHDTPTPMAILFRHVNDGVPSAIKANPTLDPDISDWIDRLLARDPSGRIQTPGAAWDELEDIVIARLGARWRREARLPGVTEVLDSFRPLTPAPFESQSRPAADPTPAADHPNPSSEASQPLYVTFRGTPEPVDGGAHPPDVMVQPSGTPVAGSAVADAANALVTKPPNAVAIQGPKQSMAAQTPPALEADALVDSGLDAAVDASLARESGATQPDQGPERHVGERSAQRAPLGSARDRRRAPMPRLLGTSAGLLGLAIIAAAVTLLLVPVSKGPATSKLQLVGRGPMAAFDVALPAGWRTRSSTTMANLPLSQELTVGPADKQGGALTIGTATTSDSTLLPATLLTSGKLRPTPQLVMLGPSEVYRYPNLITTSSGGTAIVYAIATNIGRVVLAVCDAAGEVRLESACEGVIGALRLNHGRIVSPGPEHSFGAGLAQVIAKLNKTTTSGQGLLALAHTPSRQAKAASDIGVGVDAAAANLGKLHPGPAETGPAAALEQALKSLGSEYAQLAQAATSHDASRYAETRNAIVASARQVKAAMATFSALGYKSTQKQ